MCAHVRTTEGAAAEWATIPANGSDARVGGRAGAEDTQRQVQVGDQLVAVDGQQISEQFLAACALRIASQREALREAGSDSVRTVVPHHAEIVHSLLCGSEGSVVALLLRSAPSVPSATYEDADHLRLKHFDV